MINEIVYHKTKGKGTIVEITIPAIKVEANEKAE